MNGPSGNDTRPSANDTRSVFTAINPLKRRVSFRDMPNIHEYEHVSSTSTPTPSPLPSGFLDQTRTIFNAFELAQQHNQQQQRPKFKASLSSLAPTPSPMPPGFLDKTRTIFASLEPVQQHNNQQQQQMPQQQQLQNVFKFDDADDSSLSLTKSLRLPSTPSHSSADAEGMDMEEINATTVAQTPTKLLMIDKVDKYGAINEQMNHTHVIQHTPFHDRLLSLTTTNTEVVMLNELTKRHGGSSLLFGSQEGYGLDNLSAVNQTMNIVEEEQKQIFLASKTEEAWAGDDFDDLFAAEQSMRMDAQQHQEQQPQEGHDGLDELSVAAQSMSIICSDVQQQQQTNKSAAGAFDGRPSSSLSAAAVTLLTETPKSSHQTTTTKTVAAVVAVVKEPETPPPPLPMGHLSDADFEQWHDMEMERAMEHYCEAVQHYTDLYKPYYDEQKRVLDQIDQVKERIGKFRAEFDAAEQQHGERRRATLRSVENDANN